MSLPNIYQTTKKSVVFTMEETPDVSRNDSRTSETLELNTPLPKQFTKSEKFYKNYRSIGKFYE